MKQQVYEKILTDIVQEHAALKLGQGSSNRMDNLIVKAAILLDPEANSASVEREMMNR